MSLERQSGVSLVGVMLGGAVLAFALMLGLKLVPVFTEYMGIKRALAAVVAGADPAHSTVGQLRDAFSKRAQVDDISSITAADLDITKDAGRIVMSVEYSRKVPVFANVSLVLDFAASSGPGDR